jgi:DNA-binding NarL/FixJ family response regulator
MVEAIQIALSTADDFEIAGVTQSGDEVLDLARRLDPDVVLLDLRLPGMDGLEILRALHRSDLDAKLVVLSACEDPEVVEVALNAGACAFITKRIDPYDLAAALRQGLDQTLFQPFRPNPLVVNVGSKASELTDRELAVLRGLAAGFSNKEIAAQLSYAEQTVKLDLTHVYKKLGVSSRTEAMAVAYRTGLVTVDQ